MYVPNHHRAYWHVLNCKVVLAGDGTYSWWVLSRVYKQMEGRLFGPRVTHLADSLNAVNLAACSQSLLSLQQKGCKREEEKGHVYVWPVNGKFSQLNSIATTCSQSPLTTAGMTHLK